MRPVSETGIDIYKNRQDRVRNPHLGVREDFIRIYERGEIKIGWPEGARRIFDALVKENTVAIVGGAYGDEGKGRITDNKIQALLEMPNVKLVRVVAFNGGSNAGRTVENDTTRIAVHALPAGILYPETQCIIDQGTATHIEDLRTEIEHVESKVGDLRGKIILSQDAILSTDLERAEEQLNAKRVQGSPSQLAGGTTSKGIATSYAHHYDKTGLKVRDLLLDNWRQIMSDRYFTYRKEFDAFDLDLAQTEVSDFKETLITERSQTRPVGTKDEFLNRLEEARSWLIRQNIVRDTITIHADTFENINRIGVVFEGGQAAGIDVWIGSRPDVTSSTTILHGIPQGTGYWQPTDIADRIAVIKGPYTSSVGVRHLPTEIPIGKEVRKVEDLPADAPEEYKRAAYIRDKAHEFGTTTGRPRDIARLDLAQTAYNIHMSGAEVLAVTLMDVVEAEHVIEVSTHYTRNGMPVPFRPGMEYQNGIEPQYIKVPGWNGEDCRNAKNFDELPENAKKYLAFIQARVGMPIVAVTTGPKRENLVKLPGYSL